MKARLERIANAQARVGSTGADGVVCYRGGDSVDCFRVPTDKDLKGWRGPGTVFHVEKGKIYVKWQGGVQAYPSDQVRFQVIPTFFMGGTSPPMWQLLEQLEE